MTAIDRAAEAMRGPGMVIDHQDIAAAARALESIDTDVIAAVLNTHRVVGITVGTGKRTARCACSFDFDGDDGRDDFDRHRAAEVKAALLGGERP